MPKVTPIQDETITETAPDDLPPDDSQSELPVVGGNYPNPTNQPDTPFLSSESKSETTVEQHRKGLTTHKGRPTSSAGAPPGSATTTQVVSVPDPKFKTYYHDSDNPGQRTKAFWNWWNALPVVYKERCVAYVYRDWPVLVYIDKDVNDELSYIDKISGMEPIQSDNDLNDKYGAGDFHIFFNEALGPKKRTLATLYIKGSRDLKSRPPADRRINDPNQVEMTDPQNPAYIAFLRGRGVLPDQITLAKKEGELASLQAAKEMSSTVERLTDKVISMAEDKGKGSPSADESLKLLTQASINANEIQADAAKRSNEMLHDTIKSLRELENGEKGGTSFADAFTLAVDLMSKMNGGGNNQEVAELRAELARVNNDRLAALEKQIAEARAVPVAGGSPFANIKEGFSAIKEMRDLVEDISGGSKPNPAEELAGAAGAPAWLMPAIQYGLPLLGNIVQAIMVGRGLATPGPAQQPGPSPAPMPMPQAGPGQPRPQPQPMPIAPGIPAPQAPPMPAPAAAPIPIQGQSRYGLPADVEDLLYEIKTPFTHYISSGDLTGGDYADVFIANYGEQIFKQLTSFGVDGVAGAIMAFPPIVDRLTALGITEVRLKQFVGEFVVFKPEDPMDDGGEDEPVLPEGGGDGGGSAA
jgi:hypothetical protein